MEQAHLVRVSSESVSEPGDIDLVARAQSDLGAFRALYERYARPIYRYLYSAVGNQADAEDLTSQVFLKALEDLNKLRHAEKFRAWLFAIARSKAMDFHRKNRQEMPLEPESFPASGSDPLAEAIHSDEVDRMRRILRGLSPQEQDLVRLRYVAGLSFAEMGGVLNRREATVKKALYRLLDRIHRQMEDSHA